MVAEPMPVMVDSALEAPRLSRDKPVALKAMMAEMERKWIEDALALSGGVVAEAARLLTLQRTTLIEKMRKYEIEAG